MTENDEIGLVKTAILRILRAALNALESGEGYCVSARTDILREMNRQGLVELLEPTWQGKFILTDSGYKIAAALPDEEIKPDLEEKQHSQKELLKRYASIRRKEERLRFQLSEIEEIKSEIEDQLEEIPPEFS